MDEVNRKMKKERLMKFYGGDVDKGTQSIQTKNPTNLDDPLNIDGQKFDCQQYLEKILKWKDLSDLISEERVLGEQIRSLDSDMQTLVYDNYSKFISATDTIRMMKSNFSYVKDEMNSLVQNISSISSLCDNITSSLSEKKSNLRTLAATQLSLNKLNHLVELPSTLKRYVAKSQWSYAVRDLNKAKFVLRSYQDTPSFKAIREDCYLMVQEIIDKLWKLFECCTDPDDAAAKLKILKQLGLGPRKLSEAFVKLAKRQILSRLPELKAAVSCSGMPTVNGSGIKKIDLSLEPEEQCESLVHEDVLHFANFISDAILDELSAFVASYCSLFFVPEDEEEPGNTILDIVSGNVDSEIVEISFVELELCLGGLVEEVMIEFFNLTESRFKQEDSCVDTNLLIRALDRIHTRVQSFNRFLLSSLPSSTIPDRLFKHDTHEFGYYLTTLTQQFSSSALKLVNEMAQMHTAYCLENLSQSAIESITDLRHQLASQDIQNLTVTDDQKGRKTTRDANQLLTLFDDLSATLVSKLRDMLQTQQAFLKSETSFASKPQFRGPFCTNQIREGLVVGYMNFLVNFLDDVAKTAVSKVPGPILLILAKLCLTWANSGTITHLLALADDLDDSGQNTTTKNLRAPHEKRTTKTMEHDHKAVSNPNEIADGFRETGNELLVTFVRLEGINLAQLLRKSVEARDWLKNLEPRSVRSVIKRLIDDLSSLDQQVGQLFSSNTRARDRGSDSRSSRGLRLGASAHYFDSARSVGSGQDRTSVDVDPALATQLRRLFTQRVDIFSPVEAYRESMLLGVIKIGLKTLIECVRLQTFGKYGLQQIQVDCRYLQIHLWRFVNDERLVSILLDDVVYSVVQRCIDPVLMEDSVVDAICDRS